MIRVLILIAALGSLSACAQHREPTVNCFNFMAVAPVETDCSFEPFDRLETD